MWKVSYGIDMISFLLVEGDLALHRERPGEGGMRECVETYSGDVSEDRGGMEVD